ncbi:hypothetical protein GYMLUDRAFT_694953 [Collybiopsis luxurians FD-317 M1]|uniref:Purine-cytosine permease n=1 Tax=Collybiopsis luxurians FD-317 M1 TaxID=944289 RepID=A0A0D0BSL3_9AGAR|nr:hypothetical protein GYMLUDRAFT_694953 [Collybiopsis luxurians FD-317 M1]
MLDAERDASIKAPSISQNGVRSSKEVEYRSGIWELVKKWFDEGIETHGISPTTEEERNDTRTYQIFTIWFSSSFNLASLSGGTLGPLLFQLDLKFSLVIILLVDAICALAPAYLCMLGPKLGVRTMILSRFSFGYYGAKIPAILNIFTMLGWLILGGIIAAQFLVGVFPSITVASAIVIIALVAFTISFCGYRLLHQFATYAWIPNALLFITLPAAGARNLTTTPPASLNVTPSQIISFAAAIATFNLTWTTNALDYTVHHRPNCSGHRIFSYTFLGIFLASFAWNALGAVLGVFAQVVPAWGESLGPDGDNFGALIATVLSPAGGFGKFLMVVCFLSLASTGAILLYSFGLSFMCVSTKFAKVPRYIYSFVGTAIVIPLQIVLSSTLFATLQDILSLIGYWTATFTAIVLCEHFIFRKNQCFNYHAENWDNPSILPLGVAATLAFLLSFAIIIPCMGQTLYTGPVARAGAGDVGIPVGFAAAWSLYTLFRSIECLFTPNRLG